MFYQESTVSVVLGCQEILSLNPKTVQYAKVVPSSETKRVKQLWKRNQEKGCDVRSCSFFASLHHCWQDIHKTLILSKIIFDVELFSHRIWIKWVWQSSHWWLTYVHCACVVILAILENSFRGCIRMKNIQREDLSFKMSLVRSSNGWHDQQNWGRIRKVFSIHFSVNLQRVSFKSY